MIQKTISNPISAYYQSGQETKVIKVATTCPKSAEGLLKNYMLNEIRRLRTVRQSLQEQYPVLLGYGRK